MDLLKIKGGTPLKGHVKAAGAKNAMTKLLVASLFSDKRCYFLQCAQYWRCGSHSGSMPRNWHGGELGSRRGNHGGYYERTQNFICSTTIFWIKSHSHFNDWSPCWDARMKTLLFLLWVGAP